MKMLLPLYFVIFSLTAFCQTKTEEKRITEIERSLTANQASARDVLLDPANMSLHPLTVFRNLIKRFASTSRIEIVSSAEPGIRIMAKGKIVDSENKPLAGSAIYCYQTDARRFYAPDTTHYYEMEGDRKHARLFGYGVSDEQGEFTISTIKPNGYPESSLPAHIHVEITTPGGKTKITEFLFDDDPRLTPAIRERSIKEGFLIAKKEKEEYNYVIKVN